MSSDERLDQATRARMAAKDMLRGLRHELERLKLTKPPMSGSPLHPAHALHGLLETMDQIASAGEHLARDLLFTKRDHSRYADFFDPRAALADNPEAGHQFVRSRYAALKLVSAGLVSGPVLISESKIASALSSLPKSGHEDPAEFEARFTLALANEAPLTPGDGDETTQRDFNRHAALIVGLAGTVAAEESARAPRDLPELVTLSADVVSLRLSRLMPIFDGPAPEAILAPVLSELADALRDF